MATPKKEMGTIIAFPKPSQRLFIGNTDSTQESVDTWSKQIISEIMNAEGHIVIIDSSDSNVIKLEPVGDIFEDFDNEIKRLLKGKLTSIIAIEYFKEKNDDDEIVYNIYRIAIERETSKEDYKIIGKIYKLMHSKYRDLIKKTKIVLNNAWY